MKSDTTLLLVLAGLYLYSRSKSPVMLSPGPGQPGFVGPVQPLPSSAIPPAVNAPISSGVPVIGTGLQTCIAMDGTSYQWISNQSCPDQAALTAIGGVPYYNAGFNPDGTPNLAPLTY